MTSLRNIEPKLVVKLQPFGTERDIHKQYALRPRNYLITSCLEDCIEHMGGVNQCLRMVLFTFIAHNLQFSSVSKR